MTTSELAALVVRMATENRDWSYRRIQGALSNLGHTVSLGTIADILEKHGIEPAPERSRQTTWKDLLTQHWERLWRLTSLPWEYGTRRRLQRFLLRFFIELSNPTGKDRRSRGASQRAKDQPDSRKYQ